VQLRSHENGLEPGRAQLVSLVGAAGNSALGLALLDHDNRYAQLEGHIRTGLAEHPHAPVATVVRQSGGRRYQSIKAGDLEHCSGPTTAAVLQS